MITMGRPIRRLPRSSCASTSREILERWHPYGDRGVGYQLVARTATRKVMRHSNQSLGAWGKVFGDQIVASAILDHNALDANQVAIDAILARNLGEDEYIGGRRPPLRTARFQPSKTVEVRLYPSYVGCAGSGQGVTRATSERVRRKGSGRVKSVASHERVGFAESDFLEEERGDNYMFV